MSICQPVTATAAYAAAKTTPNHPERDFLAALEALMAAYEVPAEDLVSLLSFLDQQETSDEQAS